MTYRILVTDSMGVLCVHGTTLLNRLMQKSHLDKVDLFAGSGSGAMVACLLAKGLSPQEITREFVQAAPSIYAPRSFSSKVSEWGKASLRDALLYCIGRRQPHSIYEVGGLTDFLVKHFKGMTLHDLPRKVFFPLIDFCGGGLFLASNLDGYGPRRFVVDAVREAFSVPPLFPALYGLQYPASCYLSQNAISNSSLAAALESCSNVSDARVFSIGSGPSDSVTDFYCRKILGSNYYWLKSNRTMDYASDNWRNMGDLIGDAIDSPIHEASKFIEQYWV